MGYDMDPEAVRRNADKLRRVGEEFESIGESGKSAQLGWDVFGLLGRPFAWGLGLATRGAGSGIEACGRIIGRTAAQLDHVVEHLQSRDDEAAASLAE